MGSRALRMESGDRVGERRGPGREQRQGVQRTERQLGWWAGPFSYSTYLTHLAATGQGLSCC